MFVSPHYIMANYVMALQSNHCTLVVAPQRTCRFIALRSVSGLTKKLYYPSVQPGRPLLYSLLQVGIQERRLFIPRSWDTHKGESLVVLDQNKQTNKQTTTFLLIILIKIVITQAQILGKSINCLSHNISGPLVCLFVCFDPAPPGFRLYGYPKSGG